MSEPQRRKGGPRDAGSPIHPQQCCPRPGPVLCGQGAGAGAEPQWHSCCPGLSGQPPALAQVSCPRWGSSPHPSPHQLQRDVILENSAPLPLHPLYSITFPFKRTFPLCSPTPGADLPESSTFWFGNKYASKAAELEFLPAFKRSCREEAVRRYTRYQFAYYHLKSPGNS